LKLTGQPFKVYDVIQQLAEPDRNAVEAINPVQLSAAGMDAKMLKREFGKDLTFWGGSVSTQTTLVTDTVEDVANSVRENMQIFAPGGGFVFTQDHNIQADVPLEKVMAIDGTANECRTYDRKKQHVIQSTAQG
jgi:uroporphyrinogen decarboxylase